MERWSDGLMSGMSAAKGGSFGWNKVLINQRHRETPGRTRVGHMQELLGSNMKLAQILEHVLEIKHL